jgi:hypothetical protein
MEERERDDGSVLNDNVSAHAASFVSSASTDASSAQHDIDLLFDQDAASWEPVRPPEVLGEFLDSRYMLPLLLPSDPVFLSATPKMPASWQNDNAANGILDGQASKRGFGSIPWRITTKRLRETSLDILQWVDGAGSHARWTRPVHMEECEEDEYDSEMFPPHPIGSGDEQASEIAVEVHRTTPLTRRPSIRTKGRASIDGAP